MPPVVESFIAHLGEMGSRWGINRTVGQVYALLLISESPLSAVCIGEVLGISRSNVSVSLKELQAWQLVKLMRRPGDRRENNWFDELQRLLLNFMLQLMSLGSKVQKLWVLRGRTVAAMTGTNG